MVEWSGFLAGLAERASHDSPSALAEALFHTSFQDVLLAHLDATAGGAAPPRDDEGRIRLLAAGRELAERLRQDGHSLAEAVAIQARVRAGLLALCFDNFPDPAQLREALALVQHLGDGLSGGMVNEWLRLQTMLHRRRNKEARRYILREKKRYVTIFRRMNEPAFVVDDEMRLVDVNPAFEEFFGLGGRECLGRTCMAVIGDGHCLTCPVPEVLQTGGSFSDLEMLLDRPCPASEGGRDIRNVRMAGASLGEAGEGAIVILRDITAQKRAEAELDEYRAWLEDLVDERTEALRRSNKKLKAEVAERKLVQKELLRLTASLQCSNADLEQFAYVASHDLREPLMLVSAFAERLLQHYGATLDERGRGYVERIIRSAVTLRKLVEALLQLSRISTSTGNVEELDLNLLLIEVLEGLEESLARSGARVEIGPLPTLRGDPVQIRQLFQNLIVNALKYQQPEVPPLVTISGRWLPDRIAEISVADNGVGIAEKDLERIFEPFVRLPGREGCEGCGMGLATCRKIVERHGGEIKAWSPPGQGTVIVLRFPPH